MLICSSNIELERPKIEGEIFESTSDNSMPHGMGYGVSKVVHGKRKQ